MLTVTSLFDIAVCMLQRLLSLLWACGCMYQDRWSYKGLAQNKGVSLSFLSGCIAVEEASAHPITVCMATDGIDGAQLIRNKWLARV